jgi:Predicted transporter component
VFPAISASDYTWLHALVGGTLIGLGSLLAAAASGKIPGISGMFSRLLRPRPGDTAWRVVFFLGLLAGAALAFSLVAASNDYTAHAAPLATILAGILVGFGTRLGGGCTSGHGVCGLGLGSKSSFVATLTFIAAAMLVVFLLRHTALGGLVS